MQNFAIKAKKTIKKVAALSVGAAMLGSTLFGAVAADLSGYPAPFVEDGMWNTVIVVGASAAAADVAGAIDISATLSQKATTAYETSTETTTIDGEAVRIDASGNPFNYGQDIADIDSKLTDDDLTILADGTFKDTKGTNKGNYDYEQTMTFTDATGKVVFANKKTGDKEADTYLWFDDSGTKYMYTYTLDFLDTVTSSVSSTTLCAGDYELNNINILGTEYSIVDVSCGSTNKEIQKVVLLSGSVEKTLGHEESTTITSDGTDYEITAAIYTGATPVEAYFIVNGETTDTLAEGDTYTLDDGNIIGVKDILAGKTGVSDTVTFYLGANKLEAENGATLKKNEEKVDGSTVTIGVDASYYWDTLVITYIPDDDIFLAAGETYTDPVFGLFKFMFEGVEKDTLHIDIDPDGSDKIQVTIPNVDGDMLKFDIAYADTSGNMFLGEDDDNQLIVTDNATIYASNVTGGADITDLEGTRFLYDFSDIAHIIEIRDIDSANNQCDFRIDPGTDHAKDVDDQTCTHAGASTTFTFMDSDFKLMITDTNTSASTIKFNQINDVGDGSNSQIVFNELTSFLEFDTIALSATNICFNISEVDTGASTGVTLVTDAMINLSWDGTNSWIDINQPGTINSKRAGTAGNTGGFIKIVDGDNYNKELVDTYGTLWHYNSDDQGYIDIDALEDETDAKVYVGTEATTVTTSNVAGEGVVIQTVTGVDVAKLDSEITDKTAKPLLLVGGPCVNTLVGELATAGLFRYGCSNWPGENFGIIEFAEGAFGGENVAIVVAGTRADDTRRACKVLKDYGSYDLTGTSLKVTGTTTTPIVEPYVETPAEEPAAEEPAAEEPAAE